jgi:hypothetical protein
MRRICLSLLLASLLFTLPLRQGAASSASAGINPAAVSLKQQTNRGEVVEIETYAGGLDRYIKQNARSARYFADTSSPEEQNAPARWQEFKTKRALDKAWQDGTTYTSSNVWFNPTGELAVAMFTFSSPSGDWAQYMTNYYRKDGTLAKTSAELRTFMGNIIRIYDRLYDSNGKLLKEQRRYLDLTTRRPKKGKVDFMDMEAPLYVKTSALPFYKLLKRR